MAKAPVKVDANGKEIAEYPKLIRVGEYTKGEAGKHTANKILVNNEEEEKKVLKEHGLDVSEENNKKKPVGWDK